MQISNVVTIEMRHADDQVYRRWQSAVEEVSDEYIVTFSEPGCPIEEIGKGTWHSRWYVRRYLWFAQPYNLLEMYHPDGTLAQLYINVASPVKRISSHVLSFIDYELDISYVPGQPPRLLDEDEFVVASARYGYTPLFQAQCREIAGKALQLVQQWKPGGVGRLKK